VVQISNSCPSNVKSKPFIDYMPRDYPTFTTCCRPEVLLGGLDADVTLLKSLFNRTKLCQT
jgi:hypothetical protein